MKMGDFVKWIGVARPKQFEDKMLQVHACNGNQLFVGPESSQRMKTGCWVQAEDLEYAQPFVWLQLPARPYTAIFTCTPCLFHHKGKCLLAPAALVSNQAIPASCPLRKGPVHLGFSEGAAEESGDF